MKDTDKPKEYTETDMFRPSEVFLSQKKTNKCGHTVKMVQQDSFE